MTKKIEIKTPVFESVKVGEHVEVKWETSNGQKFDHEHQAESYEFNYCKIKRRGVHLSVEDAEVLDFESIEDMNRYEEESIYGGYIKKYDKSIMKFPNTYVHYTCYDPEAEIDIDEDSGYYCNHPTEHVHIVTLDEYKKMLMSEIENLK
jgi:hypothetical protein